MDQSFRFVKEFDLEDSSFEIYENNTGNFFVAVKGQDGGPPLAFFCEDKEELKGIFSDDFLGQEIELWIKKR